MLDIELDKTELSWHINKTDINWLDVTNLNQLKWTIAELKTELNKN